MTNADGSTEPGAQPEAEEPAPRKRRHILRWVALGLVLVLFAGVGLVYWSYRHLEGNITADDAFDQIVGERPEEVFTGKSRPINVLVVGDDDRSGQTTLKGETPGLADTTILMHLSRDRARGYAVSVPRDLIVDRPACRDKHDPSVVLPPAPAQMWNAAYSVGGTACLIAQFEQMTDLRVDHFVVLSFEGFKDIVNALGGVTVCVPEKVTADYAELPAGTYEVRGNQALLYVQDRLNTGDGSDIGRMKRQQAFLAAMVDRVLSLGTLANPLRLYQFLDSATGALVTDPELASLSNLVVLGNELRGLGVDGTEFFTMPIAPYAPDPNRLAIGEGADRMWEQLRKDEPLDERYLAQGAPGHAGITGRPATSAGPATPDYGLCD